MKTSVYFEKQTRARASESVLLSSVLVMGAGVRGRLGVEVGGPWRRGAIKSDVKESE